MAFPVIVPRESEEMELCQVIQWHVQKGERVKQGDLLCEVDTGKATFDIEAPAEGMVLDIFFYENEEAPLLTPLAVIGEQGEEYEQFRPQAEGVKSGSREREYQGQVSDGSSLAAAGSESGDAKAVVSEGLISGEKGIEIEKAKTRKSETYTSGRKGPISPRARRFAQRNGIPLHSIEGSGPGGAVVERDVKAWLQNLHR